MVIRKPGRLTAKERMLLNTIRVAQECVQSKSNHIASGDSTIGEMLEYMRCPVCRGDGCSNCDELGFVVNDHVIQGLMAKARRELEAKNTEQSGGESHG